MLDILEKEISEFTFSEMDTKGKEDTGQWSHRGLCTQGHSDPDLNSGSSAYLLDALGPSN